MDIAVGVVNPRLRVPTIAASSAPRGKHLLQDKEDDIRLSIKGYGYNEYLVIVVLVFAMFKALKTQTTRWISLAISIYTHTHTHTNNNNERQQLYMYILLVPAMQKTIIHTTVHVHAIMHDEALLQTQCLYCAAN